MTTILDCIRRIPSLLTAMLDTYPILLEPALKTLGPRLNDIDELIFVGSGTSDTAARTSKSLASQMSGLRTTAMWPSELEQKLLPLRGLPDGVEPPQAMKVTGGLNPNGLYVFTSQTGTSKLTDATMRQLQERGCLALSITESAETPLAKASQMHVVMGCGREEFPMRTIGYVCSCLTHALLAMQIGLRRGFLSQAAHDELLRQARAAVENRPLVEQKVMDFFPLIKEKMLAAHEVIFTGCGSMYGLSLEGAVKFWEMPQKPCVGLELEEGIHGPVFGYNEKQFVVYLCDGNEPDPQKGLALTSYLKDTFGSAVVIGKVGEAARKAGGWAAGISVDLPLPVADGLFSFIEMSAVPQIFSYLLTIAIGRDISKPIDHSDMYAYFNTHSTAGN